MAALIQHLDHMLGSECIGACSRITVLLDGVKAELTREVAYHGSNTGTRNSLSDAVRALTTAQEDAHRRCPRTGFLPSTARV